ncbi:MAG: hypothetical protein AMJ46_05265 [Latescibacteria bacterium DG_63]|nr:MAG: hypothetical protein AMJ46_05265 [Latescibacteria bacterium DG_63]
MGEKHRKRTFEGVLRREFLKSTFSLIGGLSLSALLAGVESVSEATSRLLDRDKTLSESFSSPRRGASSGRSSPGKNSRALVVIARTKQGTNQSEHSYKGLLDASLRRLTGARRSEDAWAQFFSPEDVVAIKVNSITGRRLASSPDLVSVITQGLVSCGVPPRSILIWDRTTWELKAAGFTVNFAAEGPLCFGTDAPAAGYEPSPTILGTVGSCFSRIVTQYATALINVPVLREHSLAGASIALKNNYGSIHNPNKYHDNRCSPFVADVNTHPDIRNKTRLNICDAAKVQFHGGPGYKSKWISYFGGILVSTDPVALDTVGTEEIEKLQKANGLRTLSGEGRYPAYLSAASAGIRGLGISDRSRIDVINMELA